MAIKYVSPGNLDRFKGRQDDFNEDVYAKKSEIPVVPGNVGAFENDMGYQTASQVKQAIAAALSGVLTYKGTVQTVGELPASGAAVGDTWHVAADDGEYAWNGAEWESLGPLHIVQWSAIEGVPDTFPPSQHEHPSATDEVPGYMSAEDKAKLDGIAEGANAYAHPASPVGAKAQALYKVGTDAQGHVTAAAAVAKADITGLGIPAQDTTYQAATPEEDGLMSAGDKEKLDGLEAMVAMTDEEIDALFD